MFDKCNNYLDFINRFENIINQDFENPISSQKIIAFLEANRPFFISPEKHLSTNSRLFYDFYALQSKISKWQDREDKKVMLDYISKIMLLPLPPEIWAKIDGYLDIQDVGPLLKASEELQNIFMSRIIKEKISLYNLNLDDKEILFLTKKYIDELKKVELRPEMQLSDSQLESFLLSCHDFEKLEISNTQIRNSTSFLSKLPASLKELNFRYCDDLKEIPDLSYLASLEILNLESAKNLETIAGLPANLKELRLNQCHKLSAIPALKNLQKISLCDCRKILSLPDWPKTLENIHLSNTPLTSLPDMTPLKKLKRLFIKNCPIQSIATLEILSGLNSLIVVSCQALSEDTQQQIDSLHIQELIIED